MRNPWLNISAADYLGHMGSPEVDQLSVLSHVLGDALAIFRPRDLLFLGCSTGNGLEHIDPAVTSRVTGVDINPEYLRQLAERYKDAGLHLSLLCDDVTTCPFSNESFDLAHCALLFEYIDWPPLLRRLSRTLRMQGGLTVVVQRPSVSAPAVTPSRFTSLQQLDSLFRFVDPEAVISEARACGLTLQEQRIAPLKYGKVFAVLFLSKKEAFG